MELQKKLRDTIREIVNDRFNSDVEVELSVPAPQFGDFSSNIALQVAGSLNLNPRDIATEIDGELSKKGIVAQTAGPGFINITVGDKDLWDAALARDVAVYSGLRFVVEYSCPNYFKELHAGHLYQTIYGDAVARMIERTGAIVHRTNFGADVGLSAARAMWGILQYLGGEIPEKLDDIPSAERTKFIATSYVDGATADTSDDNSSSEQIMAINKRIYALHADGDTTSGFARIYFTCRNWCREYFESLYAELRVDQFEKYYPESSTESRGREEVASHIGTVFNESRGAIVFEGESAGLHTRVFVTSEGLPTYETKDLGLIFTEMDDFVFDRRLLITGKEQSEYMKVVWHVADRILPGIQAKMTHLTNGLILFGDGKKMSSRSGNVTTAMDVIRGVKEAVGDSGDSIRDEHIYLGALKYEFLKHKIGGDIAFDPENSVSLQGNSGPYLQYALVRAKSILAKVESTYDGAFDFLPAERTLVRKLSQFQMVLDESTRNFETHTLCTYLYELAGEFNVFYEHCTIVGDPRQNIRAEIVRVYAETLQTGLSLLGIEAPKKM